MEVGWILVQGAGWVLYCRSILLPTPAHKQGFHFFSCSPYLATFRGSRLNVGVKSRENVISSRSQQLPRITRYWSKELELAAISIFRNPLFKNKKQPLCGKYWSVQNWTASMGSLQGDRRSLWVFISLEWCISIKVGNLASRNDVYAEMTPGENVLIFSVLASFGVWLNQAQKRCHDSKLSSLNLKRACLGDVPLTNASNAGQSTARECHRLKKNSVTAVMSWNDLALSHPLRAPSMYCSEDRHYGCSSTNHGVDIDAARESLAKLEQTTHIVSAQLVCGVEGVGWWLANWTYNHGPLVRSYPHSKKYLFIDSLHHYLSKHFPISILRIKDSNYMILSGHADWVWWVWLDWCDML